MYVLGTLKIRFDKKISRGTSQIIAFCNPHVDLACRVRIFLI